MLVEACELLAGPGVKHWWATKLAAGGKGARSGSGRGVSGADAAVARRGLCSGDGLVRC